MTRNPPGGHAAATQPGTSAAAAAPTRLPEAEPSSSAAAGSAAAGGGRLPEVVVHGREENLLGVANTGSEGYVGADQIAARPLLRPAEVLETVPGVVVTQHSGGRQGEPVLPPRVQPRPRDRFADDRGRLPVNLPSHAHGQGYTDLNFLIPELVADVRYRKGPYFADEGDFASAGAVHVDYVTALDRGFVTVEGGSYGYARALLADSAPLLGGTLLYAFEFTHDDGPWTSRRRSRR
jgi:hypothetical protein